MIPTKDYNYGRYYGYCQGFTEVPANIPRDAYQIYLAGNQIKSLKANSFNHSSCRTIKIHWDQLENIEFGAFSNLDSLSSLYLSDNKKLKVINSRIFNHLSSLYSLWLDNNNIENIHTDSFKDLKSLRTLKLQDNTIQHLPSLIFSNLPKLSTIDLRNNELTTLTWDIFSYGRDDHPISIQIALSGNSLVCNSSLCWLYEGEQDEQNGWITWMDAWYYGNIYGPQCTDLPSWSKMNIVCGMKDERGKFILNNNKDFHHLGILG